MNKRFRPHHLIPVAVFLGVFVAMMGKPVPDVHRSPTSEPKIRIPHQRNPAQFKNSPTPSRSPASIPSARFELDKIVVPQEGVTLPRGNVLASNVGAIPLTEWKPPMGKLLSDDGVYGYFQKNPGEKSIPVAFNPRTRGLHPISSILHVKDVNEDMREAILKQGYTEYIYFKHLQRLSLRSSPEEVVKLYQDLGNRGYNVKLEVLEHRLKAH